MSGVVELKREGLWPATAAEKRARFAAVENDLTTDVAVIGGGLTGLSTALHLAEQGCSVCVLEAGDIPSGGSAYSVGLVNAGMWAAPDDIIKVLGKDKGERANRVLGQAPSRVFELIDRFDIQADDRRTGTLHLAHNAKGAAELARRAQQFQSRGAPVELLDQDEACKRAGLANIHAALLDRRAGTVNPAGYTRGLARAADEAGAAIYTGTRVAQMARSGHVWQLDTGRATVTADHVVLATNAYTERDWDEVRPNFFRGSFFQLASKPLSGPAADRIFGEGQGAWDTRTVLSSMRRDVHGRLVFGSLGSADGKPDAYLRCWAERMRERYMPDLGPVEWEYVWTGRMSFTPDHVLRLFKPAPNMLAVTGYNGRGITTGTVVGQGFADVILHDDQSRLPLPITEAETVSHRAIRSCAYESGFTLYHTAQIMKVLV